MEAIIKNIVGDMIANMENECVKVCQSYGFDVDKERLTQALTDARKFYDEGFRAGKTAAMAEIVRCKDCKHSRERNEYEKNYLVDGVLICTSPDATDDCWNAVWGDHFCSCGERRRSDD